MAGVQREGSLLCSCSEFKETEMQRSYGLWTWEEQTKKALTVLRLRVTDKNWQNENCQWFLKKTRKLFLLMPQLSSVIAAVPSFNLHFMHTAIPVFCLSWGITYLSLSSSSCFLSPAVQQRCLWTESRVSFHIYHTGLSAITRWS